MKEIFEKIYDKNEWEFGSGAGPLPKNTKEYSSFLEKFIKNYNILSIVDAGCGDWQFSKFLDWNGASYHGFDVVNSVINTNIDSFSGEKINFTLYDGDPKNLPKADLLIIKDVLQHLSHDNIFKFIDIFDKYKYCLITNCVNPHGETINLDINDGDFNFLDLRLAPFNVDAKEVFTFQNCVPFYIPSFLLKTKWLKKTILITNI